jgi:1,4-dihydroxy-2-naphthoate octaprenyltransferase
MVIPFLCVVVSVIAGWLHPLALISLIAAVPAWQNFKKASGYEREGLEAMSGLDQASAKLQMAFSGLLSIGLIIAGLL